jgi:hypothetical protein
LDEKVPAAKPLRTKPAFGFFHLSLPMVRSADRAALLQCSVVA